MSGRGATCAPSSWPCGRARTREVKLPCLFTQSSLDEQGRPVRDPDTCSYLHTLDPVETFATLVHAEALRRGAEHIRQVVFLGDGAAWIWNMATKILPAATQIVDYYHAREHVHDLGAQLAAVLGEPETFPWPGTCISTSASHESNPRPPRRHTVTNTA